MTTYYKALDAKGRSCHGGSLKWSLPRWNATAQTWTPGKWMPKIEGAIEACERGYHAAEGATQLLDWMHERIYIIESASPWIDADNKVVTAGPVRLIAGTAWDDCTARLFAVACALDVLPLYEKDHPDDPRVSDALVVAWRYAYSEATQDELSAARAAARAAAGAAAGAATWAAARDAAWDAARAAARAAAGVAAWDAAQDAARAAARAAAWTAARAAAWTAARKAQAIRLARFLTEGPDL